MKKMNNYLQLIVKTSFGIVTVHCGNFYIDFKSERISCNRYEPTVDQQYNLFCCIIFHDDNHELKEKTFASL